MGLKRGTVSLQTYDPNWVNIFQHEKKRLQLVLGDKAIAIHHVGSTALPPAIAKPIIDILLEVESIKQPVSIIKSLKQLGYEYKADDKLSERLFLTLGSDENKGVYLHIAERKSKRLRDMLTFRDYLLSHPLYLQQYCRLKEKLANQYNLDRGAYTNSKESFINKILTKARKP